MSLQVYFPLKVRTNIWHDTEYSEKGVLNDLNGLSWRLDSMSFKFSYKFIMITRKLTNVLEISVKKIMCK